MPTWWIPGSIHAPERGRSLPEHLDTSTAIQHSLKHIQSNLSISSVDFRTFEISHQRLFLLDTSLSGLVHPAVIKGLVGLHRISSYCPEFVELSHHSANEMVMFQNFAGTHVQPLLWRSVHRIGRQLMTLSTQAARLRYIIGNL